MNISFDENILYVADTSGSVCRRSFSGPIRDVLVHSGLAIVRIELDVGDDTGRNIYAVDEAGNIVWQIGSSSKGDTDSYNGLDIYESKLVGYQWGGWRVEINPADGKILSYAEVR